MLAPLHVLTLFLCFPRLSESETFDNYGQTVFDAALAVYVVGRAQEAQPALGHAHRNCVNISIRVSEQG